MRAIFLPERSYILAFVFGLDVNYLFALYTEKQSISEKDILKSTEYYASMILAFQLSN